MDNNTEILSIVAQCSATIVAVVAGFITAAVLTLSSKREGLQHEISLGTTEVKHLRQHEEDNLAEAYRLEIESELTDKTMAIWHMISPEDAEWARVHLRMDHFPKDRFAAVWGNYYAHYQEERSWLDDRVRDNGLGGEDSQPEFEEWAEEVHANTVDRDIPLLSDMFKIMYMSWARRNRRRFDPLRDPLHVSYDHSEAETLKHAARGYRQQADSADMKVSLLKEQERLLSTPPSHLAGGYWLTVALSIVGMCVPIALMVNDWGDRKVWVASALFIAGLVALFAYMSVLIFPGWSRRTFRRERNLSGEATKPVPIEPPPATTELPNASQ